MLCNVYYKAIINIILLLINTQRAAGGPDS